MNSQRLSEIEAKFSNLLFPNGGAEEVRELIEAVRSLGNEVSEIMHTANCDGFMTCAANLNAHHGEPMGRHAVLIEFKKLEDAQRLHRLLLGIPKDRTPERSMSSGMLWAMAMPYEPSPTPGATTNG